MKIILVIAAGGALGAVGRYAVMVGAGQWLSTFWVFRTGAIVGNNGPPLDPQRGDAGVFSCGYFRWLYDVFEFFS